MIGTRFLALTICLCCGTALAASSTEIEAAFAKVTAKHTVAQYHDHCNADGTSSGGIVDISDNSAMAVVQVIGMLAAQVAIKDASASDGCSAGLLPGQDRYYEIYPDVSVTTK